MFEVYMLYFLESMNYQNKKRDPIVTIKGRIRSSHRYLLGLGFAY